MSRRKVLQEGILVGLAGAAAVAAWFFVLDLITVTPGIVLKYTVIHGLAFIVFGLAVADLFALAERDRHLLFGAFTLFCCFEVAVFAAMMILGSWLLDTLQPWAILGGNLVAALVMLGILFRNHRFSLHELRTSGK